MENKLNYLLTDNQIEIKSKRKIDEYDLLFFMIILFILFMTIILFIIIFNTKKNNMTVYIAKSNIEGEGLYTFKYTKKGDKIFLAIDNYNSVTYLGSKINHCNNSNTELVKTDDGWYICALYDIEKDKEITVNYNHTPDFIKKPDPSWTC